MKSKLIISLLLLTTIVSAKELQTNIDSVMLYLSGAQIFKSANVDVPQGTTTFYINTYSNGFADSSVQVGVKAGAFSIVSVQTIPMVNANNKSPNFVALRDSLQKYTRKQKLLNAELQLIQSELDFLKDNYKVKSDQHNLSVVQIKEAATFFQQRQKELFKKSIEINDELILLVTPIERFERELSVVESQFRPQSIEVKVFAEKATKGTLLLTYFDQEASWTPSYDLIAKAEGATAKLIYKASIRQQTNETWSNIPVTLSTSSPRLNVNKPTIYSSYVDLQRKQIYIAQAKSRTVSSNDMALESALSYSAVEQEGALALEFKLVDKSTIKPDGKDETVFIKSIDKPAEYYYYAAPKFSSESFLVSKIKPISDLSLLSGTLSSYYTNNFVGTTYINGTNVADSLEVTLGSDRQIMVQKEGGKKMSSKKTIGQYTVEEYEYTFNIRNGKNRAIELVVEDHLPISKNSEIDVKIVTISNASHNKENGRLTWKLKLNSNETRKLVVNYTIKYPTKEKIVVN